MTKLTLLITLACAMLPERNLVFLNRGISGNTVMSLISRWQTDTLDLKPDLLSILVGINDSSRQTPIEEFEKNYDRLLADSVAAKPSRRKLAVSCFGLASGKPLRRRATFRAASVSERNSPLTQELR
jgi:lysophospholipase L1-like esterase